MPYFEVRSILCLDPVDPFMGNILILDDKTKKAPIQLVLLPVLVFFFHVWVRFRFVYHYWGNARFEEFIFPDPSGMSIDRFISRRVREWLVHNTEFPPERRLHFLRSLCISSFSLETGADVSKLSDLATCMRHTLATANQYYNQSKNWIESKNGQVSFHSTFSAGNPALRFFKGLEDGIKVELPEPHGDFLVRLEAILGNEEPEAMQEAMPLAVPQGPPEESESDDEDDAAVLAAEVPPEEMWAEFFDD